MQRTPLNPVDEMILHFDSAEEPWSVQLEVRAEGRLDADRLAAAIQTAVARHPMARARIVGWKATDVRHQWEISDRVDRFPLEIVDCGSDEDAVGEVRSRLQSFAPPLDVSPPFALSLARHTGGDYLMLNLSHVAGDGLSAFRLMTSILRAYAGVDDPTPAIEPLGARDLFALAGSRSLLQRMGRLKGLAEHIRENLSPPVEVATRGGSPRRGYGFHLIRLGPEGTQTVLARRVKPATVNDLLLAALAVTIRRWNDEHGGAQGRIAFMMPVNLRPAAWQYEVLGNFASYLTVSVPHQAQSDLATATAVVAEQTARFKQEGSAAQLIDLLQIPARLPVWLKTRLVDLQPLSGGTIVATAVLSNLGRQEPLPHLGEGAGAVREVWFSPPGHMPMGASVGAAFMNGELFLTLRYRHAQFDAKAAAEFAELYGKTLAEG